MSNLRHFCGYGADYTLCNPTISFSTNHLNLNFLPKSISSLPRTSFVLHLKSIVCKAKYAEPELEGRFTQRVVPANLLAAEKEEAKAVLTLFLKRQGLSSSVAARTINKADSFIDHLVSQLHSVHKARYLVGRELTTLEIRDAIILYLESLHEEYKGLFMDVVENFPQLPVEEKLDDDDESSSAKEVPTTQVLTPANNLDSKKLKALARVDDLGSTGKLPPHIEYLVNIGMELEDIKQIIHKFPAFAYYSLDGKIKPVVEFLIDLGIQESDIPSIINKRPQLCGISLSENLIPTMEFLEDLGVDKRQWAKVIYRFPALLTYSRTKLKATVDFLYEMGLPSEHVSKVLTRCPNIISYSVEDKLRTTAEYFRSMGVDIANLLHRAPQTFGLSIEANLKPVTNFFLENGYSMRDLATMISRYGALYTFSLSGNLIPKWEFFLTMGYPKSELVKFPQYFGYSLEDRIKPRYKIVKDSGVKLILNQILSLSDHEFEKALQRKLKKI